MRHYSPQEFEAKTLMDIQVFKELFSNYLHESEEPQFKQMLIKTYELAQELHEETDVVPQVSMTSLRSKRKIQTLTENEIKEMFYGSFRDRVNKEYINPLESGKLISINENDISKIVKVIVNSNTDLDPEISKKYGLFEKTISEALKDIILPRDTILGMKSYAEGVKPEYYNIFDRNIKIVKAEFNEAVDVLVKNLAVRMFKCGAKFAEGKSSSDFDLDNYKGISSLIKDDDELDEALDKIKIDKPFLDEDDIGQTLTESEIGGACENSNENIGRGEINESQSVEENNEKEIIGESTTVES